MPKKQYWAKYEHNLMDHNLTKIGKEVKRRFRRILSVDKHKLRICEEKQHVHLGSLLTAPRLTLFPSIPPLGELPNRFTDSHHQVAALEEDLGGNPGHSPTLEY